jgi:hypothetical protein
MSQWLEVSDTDPQRTLGQPSLRLSLSGDIPPQSWYLDDLFWLHLQTFEVSAGNQSDDANLDSSHATGETGKKKVMQLIMDICGSRLGSQMPQIVEGAQCG